MLSVGAAYGIILGCCAVGLIYGLINYLRVRTVHLEPYSSKPEGYTMVKDEHGGEHLKELEKEQVDQMLYIGDRIAEVNFHLLKFFS